MHDKCIQAGTFPTYQKFVTASFGASVLRANESESQWRERADAAMYRAKREGRNRSVIDGLPNLVVVGRDKRELTFILQGPDQEVLPAYLDHKVSISGLINKTTDYGGTVDVRNFSAKKPEVEEPTPEPVLPRWEYHAV